MTDGANPLRVSPLPYSSLLFKLLRHLNTSRSHCSCRICRKRSLSSCSRRGRRGGEVGRGLATKTERQQFGMQRRAGRRVKSSGGYATAELKRQGPGPVAKVDRWLADGPFGAKMVGYPVGKVAMDDDGINEAIKDSCTRRRCREDAVPQKGENYHYQDIGSRPCTAVAEGKRRGNLGRCFDARKVWNSLPARLTPAQDLGNSPRSLQVRQTDCSTAGWGRIHYSQCQALSSPQSSIPARTSRSCQQAGLKIQSIKKIRSSNVWSLELESTIKPAEPAQPQKAPLSISGACVPRLPSVFMGLPSS